MEPGFFEGLRQLPELWLNLFVVALGLVIGSFLNVVIARLPERKSLIRPGSHCPKCEYALRWYDNVPVLSYLALQGRCRSCRAPISVRYPVIELLTALLFLAMKIRFGFGVLLFVRDLPLASILIAVTFIDLEHRLIPDPLSLGGLAWGLLTAGLAPQLGWTQAFAGAALGFGLFYAVAWFYQLRTGRMGMGGGDIKLLAMLGAFVGPLGVVTTVFISSILGSVIGLVWAWSQKRRGEGDLMRVSIPYGPFLVIGGLYAYLLSEILWSPFMSPM